MLPMLPQSVSFPGVSNIASALIDLFLGGVLQALGVLSAGTILGEP